MTRRIIGIIAMIFFSASAIAQTALTHTVKSGESLNDIAQKYNVTVELLKQANPNMGEYFYAGMVLNIPVSINTDMLPSELEAPTPSLDSHLYERQTSKETITNVPQTEIKKKSKDINTRGLMFWIFDDGYEGFENYGYFTESLTWNGFGLESAVRTQFKKYANFNWDIGLNFTLGLLGDEDMALMLITSWAPFSLRNQKTYDVKSGKYKSGIFLDTYFSVRSSVKFWKIAISLGYYYWMPKWCIDEGSKGLNGFSIGLHYAP